MNIFNTASFVLAVTLIELIGSVSAYEGYKGCFKDKADRDLPVQISMDLSPKACFEKAMEGEYKYAGLQYGKQCWAGNEYGKHGEAADKDCNMACKDDEKITCGGGWRQSIYDAAEAFKSAQKSESDAENGYEYIGCYEDDRVRDLSNIITMDISSLEGGFEKCFEIAMQRGYKYAGLQYGKECWAGNEYGTYGKAHEGDCQKKCKGQGTHTCGGTWRNSVYALNTCNFDGKKYLPLDMPNQVHTDDTPADCQQRCKDTEGCKYFTTSKDGGCHISTGEDGAEIDSKVAVSGSTTCITDVPKVKAVSCARWWGDPHMITFDNLKYDCMGAGEFTVLKDMDSPFEVRGRFQYLYDPQTESMRTDGVTVTRAVSYNSGEDDSPIVTFVTRDETGDEGCSVERYHDGVKVQTYEPGENPKETFDNGSSIKIRTDNVHKYGCYMSVIICIPEDIKNVGGLLGNPTGSKDDDWMDKELNSIPVPTPMTLTKGQEYCLNWCVTDEEESMFKDLYEKEEGRNDFTYYNLCGSEDAKNVADIQDLIDNVSEDIKEGCNYDADCIMETVIGGTDAAEAQQEVNDEFNDYEEYHAGGAKMELPTTLPTTSPIKSPTASPTTSPIASPTGSAVYGDPHFKTWSGQNYDYHGICDLVLLSHPNFNGGLGMDIHVRAKKTKQWSYISTAVVRIGNDIFEVSGKKDGNTHLLNMVEVKKDEWDQKSVKIGDYTISYTEHHTNQHGYVINLGNNESIEIKTWKDMVRVDIVVNHEANTFGGSLGLMGSYPEGIMLGRNGKTIISEYNKFGQEWQVQSSEPKMFHVIEGPQHPAKCEIPSKSVMRRRLAQSIVSKKEAKIACAKVGVDEFDLCVFDVMAIGDTNSAGAY